MTQSAQRQSEIVIIIISFVFSMYPVNIVSIGNGLV